MRKNIVKTLERRDGHTHTHYCYHGSGELTEKFVERAIELGFQDYSLTEHSPIPNQLRRAIPNGAPLIDELAMPYSKLTNYFNMIERLKGKYQKKIKIRAGLEVDYLQGMETFTKEMLDEYGDVLEDGLLSIHFLPGKGGWRCVDYNAFDFQEGLIQYYGSVDRVYEAYYEAVEESIKADLGKYKPRRVSHLTLIHKFQKVFPPKTPDDSKVKIIRILEQIKHKNMELEVNMAGLYKKDCREVYPSEWIIKKAIELEIPLVYGSDAHQVRDIGRGYDIFEALLSWN